MTIFICIIKTIVGYFILMLAGSNLLGMVVRGIIPTYKKDADGNIQLAMDVKSNGGIAITIIFSLISILYFYVLYHYWNIGVVIAGAIMMFTRLPDLLFEMKTGEKLISRICLTDRLIFFAQHYHGLHYL
jgi:hypothetical protein